MFEITGGVARHVGWAMALLLLAGCPDEDEAPDFSVRDDCQPGEVLPCTLEGGCMGLKLCDADGTFGICEPGMGEACDGVDNDCDGMVDEDFFELDDLCFAGVGECEVQGSLVCADDGQSLRCNAVAAAPVEEICGDALDNDCDDAFDEGCETCPEGDIRDCEITDGCFGTETCADGMWSGCEANPEMCTGVDDDCDGVVDEVPSEPCESGQPGECSAGQSACANGETICVALTVPVDEACDGLDNDCDGMADEALNAEPCFTGPAGTDGVGQCVAGVRVCVDGALGACIGEVLPTEETCDGVDEDCDGAVDEGDGVQEQLCYDGPEGTDGVGECVFGIRTCDDGVFSACEGQVTPIAEICNMADDDCDGTVDEDTCQMVCAPGAVEPCYDGPPGTQDIGVCAAGTRICREDGTGFDACAGQALPAPELCDTIDNDCNGEIDDLPDGGVCADCEDANGQLPAANQLREALVVMARPFAPFACVYDLCEQPIQPGDAPFPPIALDQNANPPEPGFGLGGPWAVRATMFAPDMLQVLSAHANSNDLAPGRICRQALASQDLEIDVPAFGAGDAEALLVLGGWTPTDGDPPAHCGSGFNEPCPPEQAFTVHAFDDAGCDAAPGRLQVRVINGAYGTGEVIAQRRVQTGLRTFDDFPFPQPAVAFGDASAWADLPVAEGRVVADNIVISRADPGGPTELTEVRLRSVQGAPQQATAYDLPAGACISVVVANGRNAGEFGAIFVVQQPRICDRWVDAAGPAPICE